jgi:hypothetical protein
MPVSAPGPSSLSMERGRRRGRRPGRRRVVPSAGGSLPSWIVGNPVTRGVCSFAHPLCSATNAKSFPSCS